MKAHKIYSLIYGEHSIDFNFDLISDEWTDDNNAFTMIDNYNPGFAHGRWPGAQGAP